MKLKWLRGFSLRNFTSYLGVALIYPVFSYITAPSNQKLLKFTDAMTIIGFVFIILGIIHSMIHHGDFDISEYVVRRSLRNKTLKPFGAFKEDKEEERKTHPNYPFMTGLILLIISAMLSSWVC